VKKAEKRAAPWDVILAAGWAALSVAATGGGWAAHWAAWMAVMMAVQMVVRWGVRMVG
jgi:hypothetical protein